MLITVCNIVAKDFFGVVFYFLQSSIILPLKYNYFNHPILTHPLYKYFPDEVIPKLMYILMMNTALFEEKLWSWVTVKVECFVVLLEY